MHACAHTHSRVSRGRMSLPPSQCPEPGTYLRNPSSPNLRRKLKQMRLDTDFIITTTQCSGVISSFLERKRVTDEDAVGSRVFSQQDTMQIHVLQPAWLPQSIAELTAKSGILSAHRLHQQGLQGLVPQSGPRHALLTCRSGSGQAPYPQCLSSEALGKMIPMNRSLQSKFIPMYPIWYFQGRLRHPTGPWSLIGVLCGCSSSQMKLLVSGALARGHLL